MRFFGNIVALCALNSSFLTANGFTVQAPKHAVRTETALSSSPSRTDFRTDLGRTELGTRTANNIGIASRPSERTASGLSTGGYRTDLFKNSGSALGKRTTKEICDKAKSVRIQGDTLKTCALSEGVERVEVILRTEGRPLNSNVELWQGPDNCPQKISVYLEDGSLRPFRATVECPGSSNSIAIRNTGQMEFPLAAVMETDFSRDTRGPGYTLYEANESRLIQGGAIYTAPFAPSVSSVQIMLKTDGRPMNARIELLQGPNNNKQVMEVYSEDGGKRPFFGIVDTPGTGNVVRIVNTATVEFPLNACVHPYMISDASSPEFGESDGGVLWR
mmetsp:Transcript_8263/g.10483  ORF Transcript_8263/g.10483 Transcript_8263/m.10483 type:complete len:332 (+) Transcript_8263:131-1126(+)